jgi:16S rRNA (cytidine1402-2'-O)-methyltransferase
MSGGRLLLLPTPLGTSDPASVLPQAVLQAARATRYFLAERAKSARAFLKEIGHPGPMQDLQIAEIGHAPDATRLDEWLRPVQAGFDVALVTEAGCPGVADPGATIVARAHELGLIVRPLVGPSSVLLVVMAAGLGGQRFRFVGYVPQDAAERAAAIRSIESASRAGETQVFIETPYRNAQLLDALLTHCAEDTRLCVAVALTTADESVTTRTIGQWRSTPPAARPPLRHRPAIFALLAGIRRR